MAFEGIFVLFVILICLLTLLFSRIQADLVFLGGLTLIIVFNIIPVTDALVGFSNEGMLTIAALYVVAAGLRDTGAIQFIIQKLLGRPKELWRTQAVIIAPVLSMSAFMNNTPIVASFIPALQEWARKYRIPVSKILMPLSYAAILGGTCTLIGTSTNLIVNGLLISEENMALNIFEPAYVGIPIAIGGFIYLLLFGRKGLPDGSSSLSSFENTREYTIEMMIRESSPLIGNTIEDAGLRHLPGLFLVEIVRDGTILAAVEPDEILQENDRLIFTGMVESIVDLQHIQGLEPATDQVFKLNSPRRDRHLVEAVVSPSNALNGKSVKEGEFRNRYGAVILAVSRRGERIRKKVGDIMLQTGDILLLETPRNFADRYKSSNDFLLVSTLDQSGTPDYSKSWVSWVILGTMVLAAATGLLSMFQASFLAAGAMLITRCTRGGTARNSIDWQVLIVIGAALGIGNALQLTGVAETLAAGFIGFAGNHPYMALIGTYLVTWMLTEMITNNAAAVLVFPIALSTAASLGTDFMPFVMTIMFAASASFATPIGYQTNLMVLGPGGYRFTDYVKFGLPLNLIVAVITLLLVPVVWPF
ncbi:SLC13 family permease [Rhodohalobacter mucosus]|uniref:SLC13 family permease n=1 Tax=Rhodohalobacter mucosus TaxID=2079485 RepID=A0A316TX34_9BACT|nr:SLC13 family permease [Rhodohalobacter mucosus]PWN07785.1 SLC13 family permease [Rhodohalobacter mucosus]